MHCIRYKYILIVYNRIPRKMYVESKYVVYLSYQVGGLLFPYSNMDIEYGHPRYLLNLKIK